MPTEDTKALTEPPKSEAGAQPDITDMAAATAAYKARQRKRSIAIALCLAGLVVLFYVATLVKMGTVLGG